MRQRAPIDHGAYGLSRGRPGGRPSNNVSESAPWFFSRRGFTLLEMCTVLFIIVIFLGTMMPAMQSVFVEKAVRDDARQLSLMVKTAMLQSADQNRNYVIELTSTTMSLHPEGTASDADADTDTATPPAGNDDDSDKNPAPRDFVETGTFDPPNKLLVLDPEKPNGWVNMPATPWIFKPGQLCPASRVRVARGDSWLEMSFNPLTGNVESEATYFP
jgi:prepilin-type N-terminal cleavage/methylation domain-containing protein